jgi:uncharacterized membrane-anchored protein
MLRLRRRARVCLKAPARADYRTKNLIPRLRAGEIAVLCHEDLDDIAAEELIRVKVSAVLNTACSLTGRYPNQGALRLLRAGIPVVDCCPLELMTAVQDAAWVSVEEGDIVVGGRYMGTGVVLTEAEIRVRLERSWRNIHWELEKFVVNTLEHAAREKNYFLRDIRVPPLRVPIRNRPVLIVVRGKNYRQDLKAIRHFIRDMNPVLIGVDGGADALLDMGFRPDVIIGDMDSVSDHALRSGAELVVHAYPDGRSPGRKRVAGLKHHLFPSPGTSEDIAMLLAHEQGASLIVAVGSHSHMLDFLDKGRPGMASTLLTRMRVGSLLVDAKGVSLLYRNRASWKETAVVVLATVLPVVVLALVHPLARTVLRTVYWNLKLAFF